MGEKTAIAPKVSIIMPAYNTEKYIFNSIQSVINQTEKDWELIIVDDCSTDSTENIVNAFNDCRIRYIKNKTNSGAAVSRNIALEKARGKWIAFLDSDDLWVPQKLERQIAFMQENDIDFSYTDYTLINEKNTKKLVSGPKRITELKLKAYNWLGCLTVMYNSESIGKIQIKDIKKRNDYALWLKVIKKSDCYLLRENLAIYNKHSNSISSKSYIKLIKWHYKLFKEVEQYGAITSMFLVLQNLFFGVAKKILYERNICDK